MAEDKASQRAWKEYSKKNRGYLTDKASFDAGWQAGKADELERCAREIECTPVNQKHTYKGLTRDLCEWCQAADELRKGR